MKKLLVEISDEDYELLKSYKYETLTIKRQILLADSILNSVRNGQPTAGAIEREKINKAFKEMRTIPDNATNGEVIKAIFPNAVIVENSEEYPNYPYVDVFLYSESDMNCFKKDWWNALYK